MHNNNMESKYTFDERILSDLHKEAHGFRPGLIFWDDWNVSTDDQKQEIWNRLCDIANDEAERELERQLASEAEVERIIAFMCDRTKTAGCTREDAIDGLHAAYCTNGDVEYLEYCLGVRYGYLSGSLKVGF